MAVRNKGKSQLCFSFSHTLYPVNQQMLLTLLSKYNQSLTTSYHLNFYYHSCSSRLFSSGLYFRNLLLVFCFSSWPFNIGARVIFQNKLHQPCALSKGQSPHTSPSPQQSLWPWRLFIYFFLRFSLFDIQREKECTGQAMGAGRGRGKNKLPAEQRAWCPGSMTWAAGMPNRLSHPGAPTFFLFLLQELLQSHCCILAVPDMLLLQGLAVPYAWNSMTDLLGSFRYFSTMVLLETTLGFI